MGTVSHYNCPGAGACHQIYRNKMHLVAQLFVFGILVSGLSEIEGLDCFYYQGGGGATELTTCSESRTACFIQKRKDDALRQKCAEREPSYLGCRDNKYGTSCFCSTDGCNESVTKAGGMKIISNVAILITIVIFYIFQ